MESMDGLIRRAITEKRLLEFEYGGYQRVAEPQAYGVKKQKYQFLGYQVRGGSSRPWEIPHWRRFDLAEMSAVRVLDECFVGPRDDPYLTEAAFDIVLASVK
jgi:hypothetical protein